MSLRVGQGFDVHRLVAGRPLMLGGTRVPFGFGLEGHSDGDVLLHAVIDGLLGAMGEGDLGRHFPSSDPSLDGAASGDLLRRVVALAGTNGWRIVNLDATVVAEAPRLAPFQEKMRACLAELLGVPVESVNVKVTSSDGLGVTGRGEGIAAQIVVLIEATK